MLVPARCIARVVNRRPHSIRVKSCTIPVVVYENRFWAVKFAKLFGAWGATASGAQHRD